MKDGVFFLCQQTTENRQQTLGMRFSLAEAQSVAESFISLRLCAFARDFLINAHNFISYHFIEIFPDEHHREAARHISFFIIHYEGFSDIR